jgi:hypothetical protein
VNWIKKLRKFIGKKLGGSENCSLPHTCAKTRLHASVISKFFRGYIPGPLIKWGRGGMGRDLGEAEGKERTEREGEGRMGREGKVKLHA